MSSSPETIKDFLVSLGFDIDQAGAARFEATLKGVAANVLKLGAVVEGAALAIVGFTTQIATGLDNLYWASQRTGATVQGIKALGYAASQTGASAESAMSSLEGLASFIRNSPGAEGFLNRLGVQTRDAQGQMIDTAAIFTGVGQKLSSMPHYRAKQYADMLGIDERTLMAMRRGMGEFTTDYQMMLQKTAFSADKAAVQANKFVTSMTGMTAMLGILRDKIGSNLAGGLSGSLDSLRKHILDNFPKIEATLTRLIKGILWFAEAFGRMVYRLIQGAGAVIDWWKKLDESSQSLLKVFGALLVAWRLLNSAFLTSPVGMITTLIVALGLLLEDYVTWKEGGQSLIDWGKWEPGIKKGLAGIEQIGTAITGLWVSVKGLGASLAGLWKQLAPVVKEFAALIGLDFSKFSGEKLFTRLTNSIKNSIQVLSHLVDALTKVIDGDFSGAFASLKQAGGLILDGARSTTGGQIYDYLNNGLNRYLPESLGGASAEGVVYGPNIQSDIPGGGTVADRNNNPGNIRPVGGAGFRIYESALRGWEAMKNQLMRYYTGKTTGRALQTIEDIVSTWAPAGDNNDPKKYAQDVAGWMGVSPDAVLNLTNPTTMGALMQSMARKEGYSNWNSPLAYHAAGQGTQVQQQNTYYIYGGGDALSVGTEVERRQQSVNAQVMRGNQTKVG